MPRRNIIAEIKKNTRRKYSAEEKIKIVIEGLRAEIKVADLCRREGISAPVYYRWAKEFMEGGKSALTKDTLRDATPDEVKQLKEENEQLKRALGESTLDVLRLKKSLGI